MGGVSCCVGREKADGTPSKRTLIADSGKNVQKGYIADEGGELMMDDSRSTTCTESVGEAGEVMVDVGAEHAEDEAGPSQRQVGLVEPER